MSSCSKNVGLLQGSETKNLIKIFYPSENLIIILFSASSSDATQYTFIDNYCGDSTEITEGNLAITMNGAGKDASFKLNSFTFADADTNDVYLHWLVLKKSGALSSNPVTCKYFPKTCQILQYF